MIYQVICERLEMSDHIADVVECLQQMVGEWIGEMDMHSEQANWVPGKKVLRTQQLALFDLSLRLQAALC